MWNRLTGEERTWTSVAENTIDTLQIKITQESSNATAGLDALAGTLERLRGVAKGGAGLNTTTNQLKRLNEVLRGLKTPTNEISKLFTSLKTLEGINKGSLNSTLNSLKKIPQVTNALAMTNLGAFSSNLNSLTTALKPLENIGKGNINSALNSLKKIPAISAQLASTDMGRFAEQIVRVTEAMRPLATEMNKIAAGFNAFPARIQRVIKENERLSRSTVKASKNYSVFNARIKASHLRMGAMYFVLRRLSRIMGQWVTESNDYVENLNLFTIAMREATEEALAYSKVVQETVGIDSSEWIRYQAVFQNMATGFGVATDKATIMSKTLTQLGYDLASVFNVDFDTAMEKLQSGIAGQPRPMREWGFDLSESTLKLVAQRHQVEKNVEKMTQLEKSQLRFLQIVETATNQGITGDFARTLITPANAMRVLRQQTIQLKRALGNILIPALMGILPYVQAFTKVLTDAARALAQLVGFKLPEIDYSGLEGVSPEIGEIGGSADDATTSVNKLKGALASFDEINLLSSSGGIDSLIGGGGDAILDDSLGLDLGEYTYDFLAGANQKVAELVEKMNQWFASFKENPAIKALATAFSMLWNDAIKPLALWISANPDKFASFVGGLAVAVTASKVITKLASLATVLAAAKGAGSVLGAIKLVAAALGGPTIAIISAGIGILAGLGFHALSVRDQMREADLAARFGDISLSMEEVDVVARRLSEVSFSADLRQWQESEAALASLSAEVERTIGILNKYSFRMSLGFDVSATDLESSIDGLINASTAYLEEKAVNAALAINVNLSGTETGDALTQFALDFYGGAQAELMDLGDKLKAVVSEGFVNGEWVPDKFKEFLKLQSEVQEVMDFMADAEFKAKLSAVKMDYSLTDFTVDSYEAVRKRVVGIVEEQLDALKEVRLKQITVAELALANGDIDPKAYAAAIAKIEETFASSRVELMMTGAEVSLDPVKEIFKKELDLLEPILGTSVEDAFSNGFMNGVKNPSKLYDQPIDSLILGMSNAYKSGLKELDISDAARANIKDFVESLQPQKEQFEAVAEEHRLLGLQVPEGVTKGLNDITALEAIGGSMEAQRKLILGQLSTDPGFLQMLISAKAAGKDVSESLGGGILDSTSFITDKASGAILGVRDEITKKVTFIKPSLNADMEDLGESISSSLATGVDDNIVEADYTNPFSRLATWLGNVIGWSPTAAHAAVFETAGGDIAEGLAVGVDEGLSSESRWKALLKKPEEAFIKVNQINNGVSGVFKGLGSALMEGITAGLSGFGDKFGNVFKNAVSAARGHINKLIDWMNEKLNISWDSLKVAGMTLIQKGSFQLATIPRIPVFAAGGFPESGQMFVAREAGPELVGNIQGRTGVVNNEQIVDSVSAGVYRAVKEAMSSSAQGSSGGPREVVINLDGREMARGLLPQMNQESSRLGFKPILNYSQTKQGLGYEGI